MSSLFAAVTAALSLMSFPLPFSPVPLTGQSLGVMLSGLILGPWWGAASMLAYVAIGCVGFPVFAGGRGGAGVLFGPTGGYLAGFVLGAGCVGLVLGRARARVAARSGRAGRLSTLDYGIASVLGGVVVVHITGALWLAVQTGRTFAHAFMLGSAPFLPGDVVKAAAAAFIASRVPTGLLWSRTR